MVTVQSVQWQEEAWEVRFDIKEGVYDLKGYPVRVTHLGLSDARGLEEDLAMVAEGLLRGHMRRGAVPPHAVVINWSRVVQLAHAGSPELMQAVGRINQHRRESVENALSEQF